MTRVAVFLTGLFLAACEPVAEPARPVVAQAAADPVWDAEVDRYLSVNVQPSDPLEVVMWRGVRCDFLAEAIGRDPSAQDRAIRGRMDELACGVRLRDEAGALRAAHADDPLAIVRLDALLAKAG